ncbi:2Fe-2S iron-sulfur cluster-binding protein [Oscillatoria amoena NRMC-F 0135]|nr:2Fe-2S iron-sulfur cluster-binding protein [Oscillatoria amoena NRMC-F 0135]
MTRIVIRNLGKTVEVSGFPKTILRAVQEAGIDWMHACGGKGRCTTCKAIVLEGEDNLEPLTAAELRYQKEGLLLPGERLACQAIVLGETALAVPEDGKLPHLQYL